ncbi:sensor histidine kinase [Actinomycetospora sp. NBC_00405]|uniref:sensor histidine kinase n=1 Tax=Actinomycetospora sp. NBC_00405 TaxID=2975952 RepID=UPI002E1EA299
MGEDRTSAGETSADSRSRPAPWAPGRWRVRTKVVAVVLVPLLLALVLATVTVGNQLAERSALQQVAAGTRLSGMVAGLVDALQVERSEATAFVAAGRRSDRTPLDLATDRVDRAVVGLRDAAPSVSDLDPGVQDRYDVAVARLDGLQPLRSAAVATRFPAPSVVTAYTSLVEPLLALARDVAGTAGQTAVVRPATSLAALGRAKEQAEVQHALLLVAASGGTLPAGDSEALRGAVAEQAAATAEFEAGASPAQVQVFDDTVAGPEVDQRIRILQTALLRDAEGQPVGVDPVAWDRAAVATREAMRTVETGLFSELERTADALVSRAGTAALIVVVAVVLGVLLAVLLAALIAGSLITPLRRLRYSALDVADRRLPASIQRLEEGSDDEGHTPSDVEPVPIDTDEEVGEVARAFDTVHREAVRLAGEQARLRTNLNALFVNLSRRSQGLVERQLLLIDALEGREEDPDVLAELFQLDNLATRMRRNGENLLVLGGSAPARGGSEPVPVTDLVRGAVGEIEDYTRVDVRPTPAVHLRGGPADDLTHLLAELLDNATTYSPPGSPVVVSASRAPDGGLVVEVADQGLGMDDDELADANTRLERPVLLDSSVPRQMGLFVVGALARRHDIVARLLPGDDGGIVASVQVPAALLVHPVRAEPDPVIPEPRPVRREEPREAPDGDPLTDRLPVVGEGDGPAESPIFEEMVSAWFSETSPETSPETGAPAPRTSTEDADDGAPAWRSTADEGWRAVAARTAGTTGTPREQTGAGLPRRRRGAELVPGGATSAPEDVPTPRRAVDAEALRGRMGSFQDGMRRGRREVDTDSFERVDGETGREIDPSSEHDTIEAFDAGAGAAAGPGHHDPGGR